MLHSLVDRVSKGGNMLLNIAPMADGTIPSGQQTILRGVGDWLHRFGESIYATRLWAAFGEGPTQMGGGSFSGPREGTNRDVRFTRTKDNSVVYAIVMGWPGGSITISSMTSNRLNLNNLVSAQLMGN